jgi:NitT/TauT family transport system substrate-binding protein
MNGRRLGSLVAVAISFSSIPAIALEKLKIAIGGGGTTYDTAFAIAAKTAGIYEKHGLDVEFLTTSGGGETLQAVVSRSVDIGLAAGLTGVMGAFSKGAPLRAISAQDTGADETFVYVPANSPIKSFGDANGKTAAFSTVGASTYTFVSGLAEVYNVKPKMTATGSIPATYAAVMSGQIDVGWGALPFGLQEQKDGKIRILAWGSEVKGLHDQTIRVNISHAATLAERKDAIRTFMRAYVEALDWAYASPDAVRIIAKMVGAPEEVVEETRSHHTLKAQLQPFEIHGLDRSMRDAIEFKYISAPLTKDQQAELFQMNDVMPKR